MQQVTKTKQVRPLFLSKQTQTGVLGCRGCTLDRENLYHPKMMPTGSDKPHVYILGEAPGEKEDEEGEQFIGSSGKLLRGCVPKEWESRIRWNNTIRCRPPDNRDPTELETECCRALQVRDIEQTKPKIVVLVGRLALKWAFGSENISLWHGRFIPTTIGNHRCWIYCIYHPAFILRNTRDQQWADLLRWTVKNVFERAPSLVPPPIESPNCYHDNTHLLLEPDLEVAKDWLARAMAEPDNAVDIETNALRPYKTGAKILSIAVGTYGATYAIPVDHPQARWSTAQKKELRVLLRDYLLWSTRKWAHLASFELEWLSHFFGDGVLFESDWGCTAAQAYTIDPRRGALGLDELVRINFGFYLKSLSYVRIKDLESEPLEKVLRYNALDTKYTDALRLLQEARLQEMGLDALYQMHAKRIVPIVRAQRKGLVVNTPKVLELERRLDKEIAEALRGISELPDVVSFSKTKNKPFNPESSKSLTEFMRDHLGWSGGRRGSKYSTDEEVMEKFKHPISAQVIKLRKARKNLSTYIEPYLPKTAQKPKHGKLIHDDGLVHCYYHYISTVTGRLSSSDPNEQNFPKRKFREVRSIVGAPHGHFIVSFDMGQIEARLIATISNDLSLIEMIRNDYDIHQDWAEQLAAEYPHLVGGAKHVHDKARIKKLRGSIKTSWTFALFYGSTIESVALSHGAAEVSGGKVYPKKGIRRLYDEFWLRYSDVKTWQDELLSTSKKRGYVESPFGRRRWLPMSDNEIINSPVQGTASDLVVRAWERLTEISYRQNRPQLQAVMNVHDDLTFYLPDGPTLEEDIREIAKEMVRIDCQWIRVPLMVECSLGHNWGEQEEVAKFNSADFGFRWN